MMTSLSKTTSDACALALSLLAIGALSVGLANGDPERETPNAMNALGSLNGEVKHVETQVSQLRSRLENREHDLVKRPTDNTFGPRLEKLGERIDELRVLMAEQPRLLARFGKAAGKYRLCDELFSASHYQEMILDRGMPMPARARAFLEFSDLDCFTAFTTAELTDAWVEAASEAQDPQDQLQLVLAARPGPLGQEAMRVLVSIVHSGRDARVRDAALNALGHNYREFDLARASAYSSLYDPSESVRERAAEMIRRYYE